MVADINDEDAAALEMLEAERARRLQEKIYSGEVVSIQTTVVVEASDESTEDAVERHLANLPTLTTDVRPIHYDLLVIVTGVPRGPHVPGQCVPPQTAVSSKGTDHPDEVEPAAGVLLSSHSQPAYIFVTTRQATNDDPGAIAEALWSVDEEGCVVLTNLEGRHITGRALLKGEDPAVLARVLLRERKPNEFQEPIHYPKLGLA